MSRTRHLVTYYLEKYIEYRKRPKHLARKQNLLTAFDVKLFEVLPGLAERQRIIIRRTAYMYIFQEFDLWLLKAVRLVT